MVGEHFIKYLNTSFLLISIKGYFFPLTCILTMMGDLYIVHSKYVRHVQTVTNCWTNIWKNNVNV